MASVETPNEAVVDGFAPLPASKPSVDWTAQARATTIEVQRYTRFVGIMKRALPMAAAALLAAVAAYSLQPRLPEGKRLALTLERVGILNNDLMMIKPRLTGVDADGNPYVVTADQAIQDLHNSKRAQLHNVSADQTLKAGDWLNATATQGLLDGAKQRLWLWGIIDVYSDKGYEVHTTAANIDMRTGTIIGTVPAHGQGPLGTFSADRFKVDRGPKNVKRNIKSAGKTDATKIFLYGHVHMTILKHGPKHS
jgi:lipopolysaccharide export system protein LptC